MWFPSQRGLRILTYNYIKLPILRYGAHGWREKVVKKLFIISVICCALMVFLISTIQADQRFIDNGDGTVSDTLTNLMWAASDNMGDITWQNAKIYCENPPIAGYKYSDWRMPTIKELKTLYTKDGTKYETDCGLNVRIDPIIRLSCAWVWTIDSQAISAYAFSFRKGYHYSTLMLTKKYFRALPVRTLK